MLTQPRIYASAGREIPDISSRLRGIGMPLYGIYPPLVIPLNDMGLFVLTLRWLLPLFTQKIGVYFVNFRIL